MARFKGRPVTRPDLFVPVAVGAVLIVALVFLIWFLVDKNGLMIYLDNLSAPYRR